jgi:hypothetical protein
MPGLLRGIARTAAVAGTATAVSNRVSRRQAGRWAQQEQQAAPPQGYQQAPQYQQPPPAYQQQQPRYEEQSYEEPVAETPPADPMTDTLAQLEKLGQLKAQGVLTQAEFDQQKQRILAGP